MNLDFADEPKMLLTLPLMLAISASIVTKPTLKPKQFLLFDMHKVVGFTVVLLLLTKLAF